MTPAKAAPFGAAAIALSAVLLAGSVRLVREGRSELAASDAAWARGDALGAAVHARGAARAYVPGAEHVHKGYEKLRQIGETSERRADFDAALFAWRAVLSAADSSRPFSAVGDDVRPLAEASVARLSAAAVAAGRPSSTARRTLGAGPAAGADTGSRMGWGALLLAGAALWCGAGAWLARRGWGSDRRLVRGEVRTAAGMALAGLVAWLAGLLFG